MIAKLSKYVNEMYLFLQNDQYYSGNMTTKKQIFLLLNLISALAIGELAFKNFIDEKF
jgi:hypothetical protein